MKEIYQLKLTSGKSTNALVCHACDLHTRDYHEISVPHSIIIICDHCARLLANSILKGNVTVTKSTYLSKKCLTSTND